MSNDDIAPAQYLESTINTTTHNNSFILSSNLSEVSQCVDRTLMNDDWVLTDSVSNFQFIKHLTTTPPFKERPKLDPSLIDLQFYDFPSFLWALRCHMYWKIKCEETKAHHRHHAVPLCLFLYIIYDCIYSIICTHITPPDIFNYGNYYCGGQTGKGCYGWDSTYSKRPWFREINTMSFIAATTANRLYCSPISSALVWVFVLCHNKLNYIHKQHILKGWWTEE